MGTTKFALYFLLAFFWEGYPLIHLCQFPAVITVCLSITVYEKKLNKAVNFVPLIQLYTQNLDMFDNVEILRYG